MEINLKPLLKLNQLSLSESETGAVLGFFSMMESEEKRLETVDTSEIERMVHVIPLKNILRDDVSSQPFTRDELQKDAPEKMDGYWQVPRLVE